MIPFEFFFDLDEGVPIEMKVNQYAVSRGRKLGWWRWQQRRDLGPTQVQVRGELCE